MILQIASGIFLVLHGVVHLLYFGQSAQYFELQPGMKWPSNSWALSSMFDNTQIGILANAGLLLAAIGFVASGAGVLLDGEWWRPIVLTTAVFSSIMYGLLWDGTLSQLDNQGWIGVLINIGILGVVLAFQ